MLTTSNVGDWCATVHQVQPFHEETDTSARHTWIEVNLKRLAQVSGTRFLSMCHYHNKVCVSIIIKLHYYKIHSGEIDYEINLTTMRTGYDCRREKWSELVYWRVLREWLPAVTTDWTTAASHRHSSRCRHHVTTCQLTMTMTCWHGDQLSLLNPLILTLIDECLASRSNTWTPVTLNSAWDYWANGLLIN